MPNYFWDLGDGSTSTDENPIHKYKKPGVYTVTLKITDDYGASSLITQEKYITITNWDTDYDVSITNTSWNYGIDADQGIGYSKNSGYFPMPEARVGLISIIDENNIPVILCLDHSDGKFYNISTRDTFNESIERQFKDKIAIDGTGGYDITPSVTFREDRGTFEKYLIQHLNSRIYIRPRKENLRDETVNHDADTGLLNDITFETTTYVDGVPDPVVSTAEDIGNKGDIIYDRLIQGHRIQTKFTASRGDFSVVGRQIDYKTKDIPETPDSRITTEGDYQNTVTPDNIWLTRGTGYTFNRISGSEI
jgi:PKD repeat protein